MFGPSFIAAPRLVALRFATLAHGTRESPAMRQKVNQKLLRVGILEGRASTQIPGFLGAFAGFLGAAAGFLGAADRSVQF